MNEFKITYLNNVKVNGRGRRTNITFQHLLDLYNEPDDDIFKSKLEKVGYKNLLEWYRTSALSYVEEENWEKISSYWCNLAFFHKSVYRRESIDILDFIDINRLPKTPINREDFEGIDKIPEEVFLKVRQSAKKGVYSLFKELNPAFIFGRFKSHAEGIELFDLSGHCGLMALDIDLPLINQGEIIHKLRPEFSPFAILCSPSKTIRPILRLDFTDEHLIEFAQWRDKSFTSRELEMQRFRLMETYQQILFNKIQASMKDVIISCVDGQEKLIFDNTCTNPNRAWFLGRSKNGHNQILDQTAITKLSHYDCMKFGGKHAASFKPRVDIFGEW